jgi:hypothetical protein
MKQVGSLRAIGLLLLVGILTFSAATIIAEPFEQETPQALYSAISSNLALYRIVNLLGTIGMVLILISFFLLALLVLPVSRSLFYACVILFSAALIFWMAEIISRLASTTSSAQLAMAGAEPPNNLGIGFDPLFLGFFITALSGAALLVWSLGKAGILAIRTAAIGSFLVLASGIVAALFYPSVGGVERVMFYPLVLVFLPLAIFLIVKRPQPSFAVSS